MSFTPSACSVFLPESPSAVLALVPDPAGEAHTAARPAVTLAVHTRFVAFLRLGEALKTGKQHDGRQQERSCERQQAPAPVRARAAGPPRRPGHSPTKRWLLEAGAPQLEGKLADKRSAGALLVWTAAQLPWRYRRSRWSFWLLGGHLPSAATSRISTSRSDVLTTEMRNGSKDRAHIFKLHFLPWKDKV